MVSNHFVQFKVDWSAPVLIMCASAIFLLIIQKVFADYLQRWGFTLQANEIEVDEDLPPFLTTVKLSQADEILKEEQNMNANYGASFQDVDTIDELRKTVIPKNAIQGTPWYSVLSNPKYANLFYYIGAHVNERYKIIEDGAIDQEEDGNTTPEQQQTRAEQSDMIVLLLNLAYIPD